MVAFDKLGIDPKNIKDIHTARKGIVLLYNLVEEVSFDNTTLREENQKLRDENALLRGEQGKPDINGRNRNTNTDISSERERKETGKARNPKGSKNQKLHITRTEPIPVNKESLPRDAVFKGYETVIVQDIVITPEVIEFKKEVYYSPSLNKSFTGNLPQGYADGSFGPHVKSLIILLKTVGNMTEPKIAEFLKSFKIVISEASIDRILNSKKEPFHKEKEEIFLSGIKSTKYQHIDDTSQRVNGENWYTQVLCNPYYSAYFTGKRKDRLTILKIISMQDELTYLLNPEGVLVLSILSGGIVPEVLQQKLDKIPKDTIFSKSQIDELLTPLDLKNIQRTRLLEAMAITAYRVQKQVPIIDILVSDDAPQFKLLTKLLALCWIHDGRHYKKLHPVITHNLNILKNFLRRYWEYYRQLLAYKENPSVTMAYVLSKEFDVLFSTQTDYRDLNERIAKTKSKKEELMLVLDYPDLPLHNNPAELGARTLVRKRDVSLQTRTLEGTRVQDTFLTIVETAKKLKVNIYDYILDRISQTYSMPSLADLILEQSGYYQKAAISGLP